MTSIFGIHVLQQLLSNNKTFRETQCNSDQDTPITIIGYPLKTKITKSMSQYRMSMYSQTIEAALSHGLDQPHKKGYGDVVPLLLSGVPYCDRCISVTIEFGFMKFLVVTQRLLDYMYTKN